MEEIAALYKIPVETMTQTRDLLIFAIGICTLTRSAELISLEVKDIEFKQDGFLVLVHRKKACASRAEQEIFVHRTFFGWNIMENLKKYMECIPGDGPLWRRIPPLPKNVLDFAALAPTTIDSTPTKMAAKLKLDNPKAYHSHSLRRTGATLLALAGRTEEQIKTMGNWSSASAVIRYIENSEVSKRTNARALAVPDFIAPEFRTVGDAGQVSLSTKVTDPSPKVTDPTPKVTEPSPKVTEPNPSAVVLSTVQGECVSLSQETEDNGVNVASPPPTKKKCGGVMFTGCINQVFVVNSLDSVMRFAKK